ncbi:MAG: co-chaperone GroES, partial [Ghiorsea sp.]|nr:co-chaperone GroES [Ghiorsea sp.]
AAKEKPLQGEILAVGKGKLLDNGDLRALDVAVGDIVIFSSYAGTEIKIEGEPLLLMREDDILGVLSK